MRNRSRLTAPSSTTATVLPAGIAAAVAAVVISLLTGIYLLPFATSRFMHGPYAHVPSIVAGDAYFDKPDATLITVQSDMTVYVGPLKVRDDQLQEVLAELRARYPSRDLELRAARTLTLGDMAPVFGAMRQAGYERFWVFGKTTSVLQVAADIGGT